MPQLILASTATSMPMGAEIYQAEIARRAPYAMSQTGLPWSVRREVVRSMRSRLAGDRRLPMGVVTRGAPWARAAWGLGLYPFADVLHRMNLELPPGPRANAVTLHDVVAWRFDDEAAPVPAAAEELRRADAVICVSRFSAEEAVALLGVKSPHVVYNGVDPSFLDAVPLDPVTLDRLGVRTPYVLTAGGASRRKNLEALAGAWRDVHSSRPDLTLVLSGPPHPRRSELFAGLPGVRLVGRLPAEVMPGLVAASAAVIVPSLYEGFGLPALEGMATGVPVVAARTSSLPEVVGDAGILVEPTASDIAEGTVWAVSGDAGVAALAARGRTRAAGFTWERSAAEHARIWASLA